MENPLHDPVDMHNNTSNELFSLVSTLQATNAGQLHKQSAWQLLQASPARQRRASMDHVKMLWTARRCATLVREVQRGAMLYS